MVLIWRHHPDLNRGIKVLQTSALPLGYGAIQYIICAKNAFVVYRLIFSPIILRQKAQIIYMRLLSDNGAEDEIRTRDVHLGKVTLYH